MSNSNSSSNVEVGRQGTGIMGQTVIGAAIGNHNQTTISQAVGNLVVYGQVIYNNSNGQSDSSTATSQDSEIGPNPYKGLQAFQETDGDRFFGRDQQIKTLWEKFRGLHEESKIRFIAIYGPSGSGKSSLARAGLIPELARRPLPGRDRARVATLVPGIKPLESLALVLARVATDDPSPVEKSEEFKRVLKKNEKENSEIHNYEGLRRIANALPNIRSSPLIVLVDQFEEVFTLCENEEEREAFIGNLLCAADDSSQQVSVIITLRSDFLGATQENSKLNQLISSQGYFVAAMSEKELWEAITKPAELANHPLDSSTVQLLIEQTEGREGALPLLQFALQRIWEGLTKGQEPARTLEAIGGVGGALAGEAQRIFESLSSQEQEIARRVFLGLVQLGEGAKDTRRRTELERVISHRNHPEQVQKVIARFSDPGARLITLADNAGTETAEVTHEALFDSWTQMKDWLNESRSDLRFQRRLDEAATIWDENKRPEGNLWRSPDLDLLKKYHDRTGDDMTPLQMEFFTASVEAEKQREEKERERLKTEKELEAAKLKAAEVELEATKKAKKHQQTLSGVLAVGLVATLGAALFSTIQARRVEIRQVQGFQKAAEANRLAGEELEAVMNSLQAGKALQDSWLGISYDPALRVQVLTELHETLFAAQEHNRLIGHEGPVNHVDFSPDGQHLATTSDDDTARIWDISGKTVAILKGHTDDVNCIHYSPDGKNIITCSDDKTARIWDSSGKEIAVLKGHEGGINSITYSPDGKYIATSSDDGTTRIWNTNGEEVRILEGHEHEVWSQTYSPDSRHLATRGGDDYYEDITVRIWDTFGEQDPIVLEHPSDINDFEYSPDGKYLATVGEDGTGRIWDTTGQQVAVLQGHKGDIWRVSYSPDGTRLATGGEDGTVRIWDTSGRQLFELKGHLSGVNRVLYGKQYIASAGKDGTVRLWTTSGRLIADLRGNKERISNMAYSPGGKYLATVGQDSTVRLWDLAVRQDAEFDGDVEHSPNMKYLTIFEGDGQNRIARIKDIETGSEIELRGQKYPISSVEYSPDEKSLVITESDEDRENQIARLWDLQTNREVDLKEGQEPIAYIEYSPNGKYLTIYEEEGENRIVRIRNTSTGSEIELRGQKYPISSVEYSPNEKSLIITEGEEENRIVRIKDIETGSEIELRGQKYPIRSVEYSPDEKSLIITEGEEENRIVRIKDIETGSEIELRGQKYPIRSVEYSPDEKYLVITEGRRVDNFNWTVLTRIRNVDTGNEIKLQEQEYSSVDYEIDYIDYEYSPNEKYLIVTIKNWDAKNQRYIYRLHLWDLQANREIKFMEQQYPIRSIEFSPDEKYVIINEQSDDDRNKIAHLWDLQTNREVNLSGQKEPIRDIAYSSNWKYLAIMYGENRSAQLWDLHTNRKIELKGQQEIVNSVVFSPDENCLVTITSDGKATLWGTDGNQIIELEGHRSAIYSVEFTPDGQHLITSATGSTRIRTVYELDDLMKRGCDWVKDYLETNQDIGKSDRELCEY